MADTDNPYGPTGSSATNPTLNDILVFDGTSWAHVQMSGDATIDSTGAVVVANDSHTHTLSNISDVTADTAEVNKLDGMTTTQAELNLLTGLTASAAELNQLDGNTVGGSTAGDIVTINATQTLTGKTLTSPKINENVAVTATATEINILDDYAGFKGSLFKNALLNGNMDVAQGGISFTGGTANADLVYTLDQWKLFSDGNDIVDVTQAAVTDLAGSNFAIALDVETANKKFGIAQWIENKNTMPLFNKTVTLSFYAKRTGTTIGKLRAGVISWNGTADTPTSDFVSAWEAADTNPTLAAGFAYENTPADCTLSTSWTRYTTTCVIDTASIDNIGVFIWADDTAMDVGDFVYITQVQLNEGSVALPFQPRHYSEELALCQRYYEVGENLIWSGDVTSGNNYFLTCFYAVPKRIAVQPSMTMVGNAAFAEANPSLYAYKVGSFVAYCASDATAVGYYEFSYTASARI